MKKHPTPHDAYRKRCYDQLIQWVAGNSIHNEVDGECCPDFSCCKPELKAPEEIRKTYMAANDEQRETFLFSFLGNAISLANELKGGIAKKVFIANGKDEINSELN